MYQRSEDHQGIPKAWDAEGAVRIARNFEMGGDDIGTPWSPKGYDLDRWASRRVHARIVNC